jgi:hypothetical protein
MFRDVNNRDEDSQRQNVSIRMLMDGVQKTRIRQSQIGSVVNPDPFVTISSLCPKGR